MTKVRPFLPRIFLLWSLLILPLAGYGHGNQDGHAPVYDPVENEFGSYAPGMKAGRTIVIDMTDQMRFTPDFIKVKKGAVIRFEHNNNGNLMHEFVLGTEESLDQHAEMMKKFPNMEHDEPYMAHVAPGKSGIVEWRFDKVGSFGFACLIPGHFDAGMKGRIVVEM